MSKEKQFRQKEQKSESICFLNNTATLKMLESNVSKYWILCLDRLSMKYESRIKFNFRNWGSQKLFLCTLSLEDTGWSAPLRHGGTRKNQETDGLKTMKTKGSPKVNVWGTSECWLYCRLREQLNSTEVFVWRLGGRIQLLNLTLWKIMLRSFLRV